MINNKENKLIKLFIYLNYIFILILINFFFQNFKYRFIILLIAHYLIDLQLSIFNFINNIIQ